MASIYEHDITRPNANSITLGSAVVPYDPINLAWVKVGGKKIDSRKLATEYAKKLDQLIRGKS